MSLSDRPVFWPAILIGCVWAWYSVFTGTIHPLFGSGLVQVLFTIGLPLKVSVVLWRARDTIG